MSSGTQAMLGAADSYSGWASYSPLSGSVVLSLTRKALPAPRPYLPVTRTSTHITPWGAHGRRAPEFWGNNVNDVLVTDMLVSQGDRDLVVILV